MGQTWPMLKGKRRPERTQTKLVGLVLVYPFLYSMASLNHVNHTDFLKNAY